MKRLLIAILTFFCVLSCHQVSKPKKPKNLISREKMVDIIIDMSLLTSTRGFDKKNLDSNGITVQSYIYDKYNIDSLQFAESNEYYIFNLDEYDALYEKVDDSLKVLKKQFQEIQDQEEEAKRKKDSLDKLKEPDLIPIKHREVKNLKPENLDVEALKKKD
ncbi:DUF4296 domain-containing protein [Formosa sediminum]|uniref:DUF4296 domain-containing protein n=1 Tax=Formosa sediminum TaxID=2594004 RepID=A0A516GPR4_9FLAO|nr:DUF4296 domain-containing protein [Formosa sediminum]QDO93515.1 DUF4296 domain-containing protein [Formosa sediminum]